ncbi:amidohydrolase family protein [Streptomyces sp. NPDC088748]|uniref:amidohydrolase family protein n=1 Tax=Streptomyces sp. NPDC088748 TaxID=3365887 RepID=UPI00381E7F9A
MATRPRSPIPAKYTSSLSGRYSYPTNPPGTPVPRDRQLPGWAGLSIKQWGNRIALDERCAVVFVHPAELPAPPIDGIPPFAANFLLDTMRAAFLLVRNGVVRRHPRVRFIFSHGGGFIAYSSHRMAVTIANDTGRSPLDVLDVFRSFYFDTALSSSPAALPTLPAFARPEHVLFGSNWLFAPAPAGQCFANGLDTFLQPSPLKAVKHTNAEALFSSSGLRRPLTGPGPTGRAARFVFKLVQPGTD